MPARIPILIATTAVILGCADRPPGKSPNLAPTMPIDEALAEFRAELITALASLDRDATDGSLNAFLREKTSSIVDKYSSSLRPTSGSKEYVSEDGTFLLVIGANGVDGGRGENASASSDQATIVVALAGDGGASQSGGGGGGGATASARNGVAVALGGRGGHGRSGGGSGGNGVAGADGGDGHVGGGGGGGAAAGAVGSIGLGGLGGRGTSTDNDGETGGATGIVNMRAIIDELKR